MSKFNLEVLKNTHYSKLSHTQWEFLRNEGIINGYGNRGNIVLNYLITKLAPSFKEGNASIHDFRYWQGGGLYCKYRADLGFFKALLRDSLISNNKPYYLILSIAFFLAVSTMGLKYFNFNK